MSAYVTNAAARRAEILSRSLTRHRLVFVQCGEVFSPLRDGILEALPGRKMTVREILSDKPDENKSGLVVLTDLETLVSPPASQTDYRLGNLRETIFGRMDIGQNFCLISRAPRVAFGVVPGSSLLEDAVLCSLPLLDVDECDVPGQSKSGWELPSISFCDDPDLTELMSNALRELGLGVLSALDHTLFEINPRSMEGLKFLSARDVEALRGAGLVLVDGQGTPTLSNPRGVMELKDALSELLSAATAPPSALAAVSNGLWYIERTVRAALRTAAMTEFKGQWRTSTINGGLVEEVLRRARLDSSVTAASLKELRDPLEWLTLGELMSIVTSNKFDNLGVDAVIWRRFNEQVVPVRNRLSHMRLLKSEDEEVVSMWVGVIKHEFDGSSN